MNLLRIAIFGLASLGLAYISRAALLRPRAHGFYRFWVWEAILALALLNVPVWFHEPFAGRQIISWLLLVASLVPLVFGLRQLRRAAHAAEQRPDAALLGFEQTAELVTSGIYRYIRHPMYSSLLLLAWGIFFKAPAWPGGALVLVATASLAATATAEERENMRFFGPLYTAYMRRTKRFIPFLF